MKKLYGFWSSKQARLGYCIYRTPDGRYVNVSEVCDTAVYPSKWDDAVPVGEVVACIKTMLSLDIRGQPRPIEEVLAPKQARTGSLSAALEVKGNFVLTTRQVYFA